MTPDTTKGLSLELPRSGLFIKDGALYRKSRQGKLTAKHAIVEIDEVNLYRKFDMSGSVRSIALMALALLAKLSIPSAGLGWAAAIILGAFSVTTFLTSRQSWLKIVTDMGTVNYHLKDDDEDCEGFVLSLHNLRWNQALPSEPPHNREIDDTPYLPGASE